MPGSTHADRSSGRSRPYASQAAIRTSSARSSICAGGDTRCDEQPARDVRVGAPGDPAVALIRRLDAVHDSQRLEDRVAVRAGGAADQRAVDVEEEEDRGPQERANDVSALNDCANAAMSRAHASMSSSWTISTDECM